MTPDSIVLRNISEPFTCGREHGVDDRCVSFHYSEEFAEQVGFDPRWQLTRIPRISALRTMSLQVARIAGSLSYEADHTIFQEIAFEIFDRATRLQHGTLVRPHSSDPGFLARVTRVLRTIEASPDAPHTLSEMAAETCLSLWHFLRCFDEITGDHTKAISEPSAFALAVHQVKSEMAKD
jgi:hypothetical protein